MCAYESEPQCVWYFAEPDLWFLQLISFLSVWVLYWPCVFFFFYIYVLICVCLWLLSAQCAFYFLWAWQGSTLCLLLVALLVCLLKTDLLCNQTSAEAPSWRYECVRPQGQFYPLWLKAWAIHRHVCECVRACIWVSLLCIYCMCFTEFLEISHPTRNNFSWLKEYYTVSVCMFVCMCAFEEACACAFKQLLCCKQFLKHGSVCLLPALLSCFGSKMDRFNAAHASTQKHQASNMKTQETCKHIHTY